MELKRPQHGFTLIEAAVAIAVVAILSGIIVPLVVKNLRDSQRARALNDAQVIAASVASQLKDTGRRPTSASGPGASSGAGGAVWQSGAAGAALFPTGTAVTTNTNTFANLFSTAAGTAAAQTLFFGTGSGVTQAAEFSYRGPYLANDAAARTDPWGFRYLILGYNQNGQTNGTPIYVISGGPNGAINTANWSSGMGPAGGTWAMTGASADDIMVRVN